MDTSKEEKERRFKNLNPKEWNIYKPKEIIMAGGVEVFSKLIGNDKEIELPKFDFTEEEWEDMLNKGI